MVPWELVGIHPIISIYAEKEWSAGYTNFQLMWTKGGEGGRWGGGKGGRKGGREGGREGERDTVG